MAGASIAGNAGVAAAVVTYSGPTTGTAIANGAGHYATTVLTPNSTYLVTPALLGYSFSPVSRTVAVVASQVPNIDFTATAAAPTPGTVFPGVYLGATFAAAFANPNNLDVLQVVNEGGQVVWSINSTGIANTNPLSSTPTALLQVFGANFAAAFPQANGLDILQVVSQGGHVVYGITSTGSSYTN